MKRILVGFIFLLPTLAYAHAGHDAGLHHVSAFLAGFIHPFTGLDHMAAMMAVGIWSMQAFGYSRRKVWIAPAAFACLLLAGGEIGFAGAYLPVIEPAIAASLLVLGLLIALRVKLPLLAGAAMVGTFAIFHGAAHGSELSAQHAQVALSGMVVGTLLLHATGMLLGRFVLERNIWLPRIVGATVLLFGLDLLAGAF